MSLYVYPSINSIQEIKCTGTTLRKKKLEPNQRMMKHAFIVWIARSIAAHVINTRQTHTHTHTDSLVPLAIDWDADWMETKKTNFNRFKRATQSEMNALVFVAY